MALLGMTDAEMREFIERRMEDLDSAHDDADQLGAYADLMRMVAFTAYQRAAELIAENNRLLELQIGAEKMRDLG